MRTTIDYGIDLGTTNSAIALQVGAKPTLIEGPTGHLTLPSSVHVTANGELLVGDEARARWRQDPTNTALEFKRLMGTDESQLFPASGKRLGPEALSAEILRELLRWAARRAGEAPRAAVITVPAMFQLPQCEATRRAAELAGIVHAPLLQEPIAAAIAHSGSGEVREGYWLVYDLGGGTFDVSLVRSRGGRLQVLDHDGDNHLGGRDFDRLIVRHAAERVRKEGRLGEFRRSDPALAKAFGRLKSEAERLRIALSERAEDEFHVDRLATTERGETVGVRFSMDKSELEALIEPTVKRTTALCEKLLSRNRLKGSELNGLVMVGGPTLTPCVARTIHWDLGIEARHFMDPMQIVAAGAALFASTQKLPGHLVPTVSGGADGALDLHLEYESMTTDPAPLLVGKIDRTRTPERTAVRVARLDGRFDTGEVSIGAGGGFAVELALAPGVANVFRVELYDGQGGRLRAEPSEITILHGFSVAKPPLSQSVGVMLSDNAVSFYLRKGAVLPARNTMRHATTIALRRGQSGDAIHVPLIQGESPRADRNKVIGVLRIHAAEITRDLPRGTEVEVTVTVDEFSRTTGRAYVPLLDQWFEDVLLFRMESKKADEVRGGLEAHKDRLAKLEKLANDLDAAEGGDVDTRVAEVEALIEEGDRDSIDIADHLVRLMSGEVDKVEEESHGEAQKAEFADRFDLVRSVLAVHGSDAERRQLDALGDEFLAATEREDSELTAARLEDLKELADSVVTRAPEYWVGLINHLTQRFTSLGLTGVARAELGAARRAAAGNDIPTMARACRALLPLLPSGEREQVDVQQIISHVK
jgi:molecular chaperone DnaK